MYKQRKKCISKSKDYLPQDKVKTFSMTLKKASIHGALRKKGKQDTN